MAAVEDAKAFFSQANKDGVSLRSHIAELFHQLLQSKDPQALQKLESLSLELKANHFTATEPGLKDLPTEPPTSNYLLQAKQLSKVDTSVDDKGVPNVLEENSFFSWAGVGLAETEAYQLFLAMTSLKKKSSLSSVRFFGKILGTSKDYYVVEGTAETPAEPTASTDTVPPEEPGTGLNACVYFVANSLVDAFTQLPDVTPASVVAACLVKKYFTGDLNAPVTCYPPFPGNEAAYLRAQIARIAANTVLVPVGKLTYEKEDEEDEVAIIKDSEEYEPQTAASMAESADSWCHLYGRILKIGRCTNPPKPEPEDGEEEPPEEDLEEETEPLAATISSDQALPGFDEDELNITPAWSLKLHFAKSDSAVAIAQSNRWPGAYAAYVKDPKTDKVANVYIGYGHENTGSAFTPVAPPPIISEGPDPEDEKEVTLEEENALLHAIDDANLVKDEGEEEED